MKKQGFTAHVNEVMVHTGLYTWPADKVYLVAEPADVEYTPAQARELAGALLRAADEADGREPCKPSAGRDMALSAVWFAYSGQEAEEFADDIVAAIRQDVATFIRANIDMQGLDFPDAESVAVWLEETA